MADTMKEAMLEQKLNDALRDVTYAHTAIRNALTELAEDDIDGAMDTLMQIVGGERHQGEGR